ncbi:MarR family winged helix-turn-helix transcriptional regulator [Arthrobacter bambusae]|uniref:MarR family winged helix-turn-helix transcriptional regulator n=1 Tax=Arthrobacter bambusae TaxID=1338426 RepID=UPI0027811A8F|nr:MarR family transcriptional regulator [Arthrobacter bambusae]MDQ0031234.1 DNA-binding MarR family transcriptional regulator [Arthrobacter bambusae]MDQ0099476.1 DNA-binding MarR family transcriptional regulator [Arthrobacter bambusae]
MPDMERWPTGRLLSTAARLVEHAWNEKLRGMDLTHAGVIVMEVLAVKGPTTQSTLAQIVRVQAQTMGKTLSRLEAHGHVSRARSMSDRRSQVVSLTEAGEHTLGLATQLEREVLEPVPVDTAKLRRELQALVRELATNQSSAVANEIVAMDSGLASGEASK